MKTDKFFIFLYRISKELYPYNFKNKYKDLTETYQNNPMSLLPSNRWTFIYDFIFGKDSYRYFLIEDVKKEKIYKQLQKSLKVLYTPLKKIKTSNYYKCLFIDFLLKYNYYDFVVKNFSMEDKSIFHFLNKTVHQFDIEPHHLIRFNLISLPHKTSIIMNEISNHWVRYLLNDIMETKKRNNFLYGIKLFFMRYKIYKKKHDDFISFLGDIDYFSTYYR